MNKRRFKETEFTLCCKMAKYILIAIGLSYILAVLICAPFYPEAPEMAMKEAIMVSCFMDGLALILLTLFDMAITLIRFFATHKVYLFKIEDRQMKTQ